MTEVYLIRHSKTLKVDNSLNEDSQELQNEKTCLSMAGEELAKKHFSDNDFSNVDFVYASNYVRAIQTAKYLAEKNNLEIKIVSDLGERKFGVDNWDELEENFEEKQFNDDNYKMENGESQKEVRERMYRALLRILNEQKHKKIAIISHATAIMYLLKKWCQVNYNGNCFFNCQVFFDGKWDYCETFKLVFDDNNNLLSIKNIT